MIEIKESTENELLNFGMTYYHLGRGEEHDYKRGALLQYESFDGTRGVLSFLENHSWESVVFKPEYVLEVYLVLTRGEVKDVIFDDVKHLIGHLFGFGTKIHIEPRAVGIETLLEGNEIRGIRTIH